MNRRLKHAGGDTDDGAGLQHARCGDTAWANHQLMTAATMVTT
jgi:hypothetical protein